MTRRQLTEMIKRIVREEYSGPRNLYSEKSAVEELLRKKFPLHNKKYITKSTPSDSRWETLVPTWNTKTPSHEYNPKIEYSYNIKVEKGQKFPTVYWWLNPKNYK